MMKNKAVIAVVVILLDIILVLSLRVETANYIWADSGRECKLIILGWR